MAVTFIFAFYKNLLESDYIKLKFAVPNICCKMLIKIAILERNEDNDDDDDGYNDKIQ